MFQLNKYTEKYQRIISRAKSQNRQRKGRKNGEIYYEQHHILPRCAGGPDTPENLVLLTAREHFICHLLLTKMFDSKYYTEKMKHAFSCMANLCTAGQKRTVSRRYKFYTSPLSNESKARLSKQKQGPNNPFYGKPEAGSIQTPS